MRCLATEEQHVSDGPATSGLTAEGTPCVHLYGMPGKLAVRPHVSLPKVFNRCPPNLVLLIYIKSCFVSVQYRSFPKRRRSIRYKNWRVTQLTATQRQEAESVPRVSCLTAGTQHEVYTVSEHQVRFQIPTVSTR
jgi:hypothetical protein